jgi:hypothetical protein
MVRDGFGDESGAKLIEQRGIDFAPGEDFMQSLKAASASEPFLKALRAAKPPEPTSTKKPINQVQVFALLAAQDPSRRVVMLVKDRGIDFDVKDDYLQEVRLGGYLLNEQLRGKLFQLTRSARLILAYEVRATFTEALNSQNPTGRLHSEGVTCMLPAGRETKMEIRVKIDSVSAKLFGGIGIRSGSALCPEGEQCSMSRFCTLWRVL